MTLGPTVVCSVCCTIVVAAEMIVIAAAAAAVEASSAARWNVAKELVSSLDTCVDVWHVVSGAAMKMMRLVVGVGFLLSMRCLSIS